MSDVDDVEEIIVSQTINQIVLSDLGTQGPIGSTGPTGSTGATGPSGIISVSSPLINSGTSSSANLSFNSSAASVSYATNSGSSNYSSNALKKYGSFYDTTTQVALSTSSAYAMKFNTTDLSNGVSVVSASQITFASAGVYNIQFSAQFQRSNSGNDTIEIWPGLNGSYIPNSNTIVSITGAAGANPIVAAWNFLVSVSAGQYLSLYWKVTDVNISISSLTGRTNPTRPDIPSIILTAQQI